MKIIAKQVALPNGFLEDRQTARISLFLKLEVRPTTAGEIGTAVPVASTMLRDWPSILNRTRFKLLVDEREIPIRRVSNSADTVVWTRLIRPLSALLRDPANEIASFENSTVLSYPSEEIHRYLQTLYSNAFRSIQVAAAGQPSNSIIEHLESAQSFTLFPSASLLGSRESFGQIAQADGQDAIPVYQSQSNRSRIASVFDMALLFHSRTEKQQDEMLKTINSKTSRTAAMSDDLMEFHKRIAQLSEFPSLLRVLGLVIDFVFDGKISLKKAGRIQFQIAGVPFEILSTKSLYISDASRFRFALRDEDPDSDINEGLLRLDDENHFVVRQIDIAGTAIKAISFADTVVRSLNSQADDKPKSFAPPSIRSQGITLIRRNHRDKLTASLARQNKLQSLGAVKSTNIEITADDVFRGFRVDILAKGSRSSKWFAICKRSVEVKIEGDYRDKVEDEGWISTSISREGAGVDKRDYIAENIFTYNGWSPLVERPAKPLSRDGSLPPGPQQVSGNFQTIKKVPDEVLPPARYGFVYRLRGRAVDLAGNDMAGRIINQMTHVSPPIILKRFEPIESPSLVPRNKLVNSLGESLDHLVIRGNFDGETNQTTERHVAPPSCSVETATLHGMFDGMSQSESYAIAEEKADGRLPDFFTEMQLVLPYLPDPFAKGIILQGLPQGPEYFSIRFDGRWPNIGTLRLIVKEGTRQASWNDNFNELTVYVPKASITCLKLVSLIDASDVKHLGIADWFPDMNIRHAVQGKMWMLTPARTLVLVNAVRQPMVEPGFVSVGNEQALRASRTFDDTAIKLFGGLFFDPKSTGKLDINAKWNEPVDNVDECKPSSVEHRVHVFEHNAAYEEPAPLLMGDSEHKTKVTHVIGDTHHRLITYSATATTRYLEYFVAKDNVRPDTPEFLSDFTRSTAEQEKQVLNIPSTARPSACVIKYAIPLFGWTDIEKTESDEQESLSRKRIGGAFRILMERPWFSSGRGELLGVVLWPGQLCDEIANPSTWDPPKELKGLVSGWGTDPIWHSGPITERLQPKHFLNRDDRPGDYKTYTLQEISPSDPGGWVSEPGYPECHRVMVVPYAPIYDEKRELWYCDIQMDHGGAYFPFVRLALVRYQPNSLSERLGDSVRDCHLSRVSLTDFIQLSPTRSATLTYAAKHTKEIQVSISGVGYDRSYSHAGTSVVEVTLERRNKKESLGWKPVVGPISLDSHVGPGNVVSWTGTVKLPEKKKSKRFRLIVKEFEIYRSDSSETQRRLVYADVLPI